MKTEIICVGTELLVGKLNTNAVFLGERLSSIGYDPAFITAVGDDRAAIAQAFRAAVRRSSVIIATGGLGPTFDDLTRDAAADAFGLKLTLDDTVLKTISGRFCRRGMVMPKNNELQAMILEGAQVLENPLGTAPGQKFTATLKEGVKSFSATVYLLPGPPAEMQHIFERSIFPSLKKHEDRIKKTLLLHISGGAESAVDEKIRPIIEAERRCEADTVSFTILASQMIIDIRADIVGRDEMILDEILGHLRIEFREALGDMIFGEDRQTLAGAVGDLLLKNRKTLALAESCTGGLVAQKITDTGGSSLYFRQGAVTYSNESKAKVLGVREETLRDHGAVSEQTAREMADGMRRLSGADYTLSLTGIAGPSGGTPEKPVGLVFIGFAGPSGTAVTRFQFSGNRVDIRERAAHAALDLLRRELLKTAKPGKK